MNPPSPVAAPSRPPAGAISTVAGPERDLLCALAYVYLVCGQTSRALALLRLVLREAPDDVGLLRILAYGLVAHGDGAEALAMLERLQDLDDKPGSQQPLTLLRSHALRLVGRLEEAQACFHRYVALRTNTPKEGTA